MVPEATFYSGVLGQIGFNQGQNNEALQIAIHAIHWVFQQTKKQKKNHLIHLNTETTNFAKLPKNMNLLGLPKQSTFSHHPLTYTNRMVFFVFRCAGRDTSA